MPKLLYPPLPFNARSYESIMTHHDSMQAARQRALGNPLKPKLALLLELACKAKLSPASRPLPWFARREGEYECELLFPLQEGPDKYSQVWVARVKPIDGAPANEDTKIVLKIIQPSLNFIPHPDYDWNERYINPERLAVNEDQTYSLFTTIQGIYVPYYYGMQKISTPSGEQAWVIAMEYIEGDDVATFAYDLQKQVRTEGIKNENVQLLGSVYRSMTNVMKAIVDVDVKLVDVHAQNFIVMRGTELVVALDFANILYGFLDAEDRKWGVNIVGQMFLYSFREYRASVQDWVNKNMPEDVRGFYEREDINSDDVVYPI